MALKTLCIFGTRPEAIKMYPIIKVLNQHAEFDNKICLTGQHQEMLHSVLDLFALTPHYNLQVMTNNQNLNVLTAKILIGLVDVFADCNPDLVLVHGDTTTTLAGSLSAYYHRIPIAHVEAGLRTGNIHSPWPEEINRKLTAGLSTIHFAPTQLARNNLLCEGVASESIFITGNTVIDALFDIQERLNNDKKLQDVLQEQFSFLCDSRKILLVTGHRRENFGQGFEEICKALQILASRFPNLDIVYPVHLNPNVQNKVNHLLRNISNIYLIPPVDYLPFVYLLQRAYLILTDSGGIQEEAASLGKPTLVMRTNTERPEAINLSSKLVGTAQDKIVDEVSLLLLNQDYYKNMANAHNPFGDGKAGKKIVALIAELMCGKSNLFTDVPIIKEANLVK